MLVFRLFRVGKNNQPSFKIVVADKRNSSKGGRFVEQVGIYNPVTKEKVFHKERIQYWLSQGVKPSPTIYNLFIKEGILEGKKIPVHKKSKKPLPAEASAKAGASAPTAPATAPAEAVAKPAEAPADKPVEKPAEKPVEKMLEAQPPTSEAPKTE